MSEVEAYITIFLGSILIGYILGKTSSTYREVEDNYKLFKYDDIKKENEKLKETIEIIKGIDEE